MFKNIIICLFIITTARCEMKSSLTFVIDDTGSMGDDIYAVKLSANSIFDTVGNSLASQIEDFVIVTFNDPDIAHRITTKDRVDFKRALSEIHVDGGFDCPEMAMKGIESGLQHSRLGSLLYVYTDASAKDPEIYENVKKLAQKKQIQIVFVLTGDCDGGEGNDQVYYQLANDTAGEVFHLKKTEVTEFLTYVKNQINNRKEILAIKHYPPGLHKFDYTVDSTMKELVVSVSGSDPKVVLTDPDGEIAPTEDLVRTDSIAIVKVTEVKPGVYSAEVSSSSQTSVKVTAETTVHFQHGFSLFKPRTIEETVTRPVPDKLSHLSIKMTTKGDDNIVLDGAQIIDMDNNVLIEAPLILVNKEDKFYTTDRLRLPNSSFRIMIHGQDKANKKDVSRMSLTPVAPQEEEKAIPRAPEVSLVRDIKVVGEFESPLELKCKISGYPKPDVIWKSNDGIYHKSELSLVELPYDYMSVFNIEKVINNNTYTCLATNDHGEDKKTIEVTVKRRNYFHILKKPEDNIVELGSSAVFECKVDAYPPADIKWYKHNTVELKSTESISISEDNSKLTVTNMLPKRRGIYKCVVKSKEIEKSFDFIVRISGADVPVIDKTITELSVREGSSVDIPCKLLKGQKPTPNFYWYIRQSPYLKRIPVDGETFHINNFNEGHVGSYVCKAVNDMGNDKHTVRLNMAYPPIISDPKINKIIVKQGDLVVMSCSAEGNPKPDLNWFKDDAELELISKYTPSYYDNGISFIATENDSGVYTCKADNIYGVDTRTYYVNIVKPVTIEVPEDTSLHFKIGDNCQLQCVADGFPKPNITWMLHSVDSKTLPQIMGHEPVLQLRRIQISEQGNYTCVATNIGGSVNITYEVNVYAPPMIENVYPEKSFHAVVGDLVLRVPCKASGNPIPDIFWIKDGVDKIAAGTEWYDQEKDGTLVIKNVDKLSAGTYVCNAENFLGFDNETYEVIVEAYPRHGSPTKTLTVVEGKSLLLNCDLSHMKTDYVRWYKDGLLLSNLSEHYLVNARVSDSGIYTCRVSNFAKSRSGNVKVNVGVPPWFLNVEELDINYEKDVAAIMDCSAEGNPLPEISWWHKGKNLEVRDMTYIIDNMTPKDKGKYFCVVKNEFGDIVREFNILSQDCLINIESELTERQPLVLTSRQSYLTRSYTWTAFENEEGYLMIPSGEHIRLQCPSGFENFRSTEVIASCERETNFTVEGTTHKFSKLKCRDEIQPTVKKTGKICLPSNKYSEIVKVGYETARNKFIEVLELCLDTAKSTTIYAMHKIHGTMAGVDPKDSTKLLVDKSILPIAFDYDEMYDCAQQNVFTSYILGKSFHKEDSCCFRSRQLVNSKDVTPGLPQKATFIMLNIIPQWSSCNSKNWDHVENRIRHLARSTSDNLVVWTGVSQQQLDISDRDISLRSGAHYYPVPKYLWKVVQDPLTKASLAIIQLNIPDTTLTDAYGNMPCRDICNEVTWMKSRHWRQVKRGYTFCCRIQDFERAFGYEGVFNGSGKVLYDVSFVADRAMTT